MKKFIIFLSVCMLFSLLQSCNTMHGIGKDIEKGGEAIQKSAK